MWGQKWKMIPAVEDSAEAPGGLGKAGEPGWHCLWLAKSVEGVGHSCSTETIVLLKKQYVENSQSVAKLLAKRNNPFIIQAHRCILMAFPTLEVPVSW